MMDIAFNEVSLRPYPQSEFEVKQNFLLMLRTYKMLKDDYGVRHLVFPSDLATLQVLGNMNFLQWIGSLHGVEKSQILALTSRKPFTDQVLIEAGVDSDSYTYENRDLGIEETFCAGLGLAHINDSMALSLCSHENWQNDTIVFSKINYENESRLEVCVPNLCQLSLSERLRLKFENSTSIQLCEAPMLPSQKTIHLRDDHGKDKLMDFALKLRNSPYVLSVINSLPFNSRSSRFIRRVFADGKIEMVLHWEDDGYGMVVQSTGRNLRETEVIAAILSDKFDR